MWSQVNLVNRVNFCMVLICLIAHYGTICNFLYYIWSIKINCVVKSLDANNDLGLQESKGNNRNIVDSHDIC